MESDRLHRTLGCCVFALLGLLLGAASAAAGTGLTTSLPGQGRTFRGLNVAVSSQWAEGRGYRPVRVDVTCPTPAPTDRNLNFELTMQGWPYGRNVTVMFDIEVPAGSTSASNLVSVPQLATNQTMGLKTWEDGVLQKDLCANHLGMMTASIGIWDQELPAILFVTSSGLDLSAMSCLSPQHYAPNTADNPNAFANSAQVATFIEQSTAQLVEGWLNYTSLDLIVLSAGDVEVLATTRPKVWESICQWTRAGGTLCVFDVGEDWSKLPEIENRLELTVIPSQNAEPLRGWAKPPADLAKVQLLMGNGTDVIQDAQTPVIKKPIRNSAARRRAAKKAAAATQPENQASTPKKPADPNAVVPFVLREVMLGQVVAIASDDPFVQKDDPWQWIFNTVGPQRWKWRFRHGASPDKGNVDFDNFLISDIGLPPVQTYRVLITLFVIVIGPVNYLLLRKKGRLHLLLFTVPAAALLASGGLVGYALLADGVVSRLRARSYTQVDQRRHDEVTWARLSYYVGLSPGQGLVFPADTAVVPLEKGTSYEPFGGAGGKSMEWTPEQHLARGWLGSRTPTQYLTVRSRPSDRELTIVVSNDKQRINVRNQLRAQIRYLLLSDAEGRLFTAEAIAPQAQASLRRLDNDEDRADALLKLQRELDRDPPRFPPDYDEHMEDQIFGGPRRRINWGGGNDDIHGSAQSLLEMNLARLRQAVFAGQLLPQSYVAIVDRPEDLSTGTTGLVESQSLHVIEGRW